MEFPDIPTAITHNESLALRQIAEGKHVLEIGALLGYSTIMLAQTAKRVVSVDPHQGYPDVMSPSTWDQYIANLIEHGVKDRVVPVQATWQMAVKTLHPDILYPYEVVFIDLTGRYEDTLECLTYFHQEWGWSLKTLAVHDCGHPDWPGVAEAVKVFRDILGMHAKYTQIDRLGVFKYV